MSGDLKLIPANENRKSGEWKDDDYDVVHIPTGRAVGRIYRMNNYREIWWWGIQSPYSRGNEFGQVGSKADARIKFAEVWRSRDDRIG